MSYKAKNISFKPVNTIIDYFKLEKGYFENSNVSKDMISLNQDEFLSRPKHFSDLRLSKKETVVLNFQTGKGKTQLCYELISEYEKNGYFIIICSPFKKIVEKDFKTLLEKINPVKVSESGSIKGRPKKIFNYNDIEDGSNSFDDYFGNSETAPYEYNVHIMTINCFLGNPGNDVFEQQLYKRNFLNNLLDASKEKKVVVFFDEIHEYIHNFNPKFIVNLLKWQERIEKIFISSATFTPASIPVIQAASLLTGKNIQIYESVRNKNTKQANIHLHIIPLFYQSINSIIKTKVQNYNARGKSVNIIFGIKKMAEGLAEYCFDNKRVVKEKGKAISGTSLAHVNLLIADTDIPFTEGQNNFGTTFKTGVDIKEEEQVLFVVIPPIKNRSLHLRYGIFSDGIPSIIQSIGRLRNGGDIHIFINDPETLIGAINQYPSLFNSKEFQNHLPINDSFTEVVKKYTEEIAKFEKQIKGMESAITAHAGTSLIDYKKEFGFWYPNLHEYLLEYSQSLTMMNDNLSFGRLLSPYVLWACLNNQFINSNLKEIFYYDNQLIIDIKDANRRKEFLTILKTHKAEIKSNGFRKSVENISKSIGYKANENGDLEIVKFKIGGKILSAAELINKQISETREAISALYSVSTGTKFLFNDKNEYLNTCIYNGERITVPKTATKLQKIYIEFAAIKKEFSKWVSGSIILNEKKQYIDSNAFMKLDNALVSRVIKVVEGLRKNDLIISAKSISFLQNISNGTPSKQAKKIVYHELKKLFFDISSTTKQIRGKKYYEIKARKPYTSAHNFLS